MNSVAPESRQVTCPRPAASFKSGKASQSIIVDKEMASEQEAMIGRMLATSTSRFGKTGQSPLLHQVKAFLSEAGTHPPPVATELVSRSTARVRGKLRPTRGSAYIEMSLVKVPIEEGDRPLIKELSPD